MICGKSFTASGTLQKHYKTHGEGPYNCLECDKSFAEIHHLNRHYHNHASVQARNVNKIQYIKCMFCEEILLGNYNLKIHYKTHGDGPYTCTGCDVKVETLKEMREHMKKSHSHHRCVVCEENFTSFKLMIAHRKTHGSGPFKCKLCEKVKKNISILVKHMKRHAENDIVQCKVCSKKISSNKLKDHMGYHTGMLFYNFKFLILLMHEFSTKIILISSI